MQKKVGIVIINYNNYKDTLTCIKSINNSLYKDFKVYLVDNASKNDSVKIIKEQLNDIEVICSKENLGFSGGNNVAIDRALRDGMDYILLLNNDTVVDKEFLKPLVDMAKRDKNVGIITGKILYYRKPTHINVAGGKISEYRGKAILYGDGKRDCSKYNIEKEVGFASGCMQFIPREVIEKVGKYNEDYFLYYEDVDYCSRVKRNGYKIMYNPKSVIYHKVSGTTGGINNIVLYYNVRNRLFFVRNNITNIFKKFVFKVYYLFTTLINYSRKSKEHKKIYRKAIKDYLDNIGGKCFESSYDE